MAILEVDGLTKSFGRTEVLKGISFSLDRGQALAIIGSSGSGKTTLLRCLNFLETPDTGTIAVNGEVLFPVVQPVPAVHGAGECDAGAGAVGEGAAGIQSGQEAHSCGN